MLMYPHINPIAFSLGPIEVHWYGIMYILGFLFFIYAGKWRLKKYGHRVITEKAIENMMFYGVISLIIGGRLGYCLFYQPSYYLQHPLDFYKVWDGGMSFHGGMLAVFIVIYVFSRQLKCTFLEISDFVAPLIPMGIFFGRIGNFINGELWGRVTSSNLPWAMVFPQSGTMQPRHPSQLYEALCEGLLLTIILWVFASKPRKVGQVSGLFLICYGLIRFGLEFFREPDSFLLTFAKTTGLSMGQWLSLPMIIAGLVLYYYATCTTNFTPKVAQK